MVVSVNKLKKISDNPGIYLFYTAAGDLIYVGKATSLKSRVSSYFKGARTSRPIEQMIHEVADIKWKETESVLEAVILESIAIKKYQPKYNVMGKDNKSWNYIVITKDEYPRVETTRQYDLEQMTPADIKRAYQYIFGPYPGLNARATMKLLARLFHISFCKPDQKRPCLYYEMGQCFGVCVRAISPRDYKQRVIRPLVTLLRGRKKQLLKLLESRMKAAARADAFEEAARLRDQLSALNRIHDIALLNDSFVRDFVGESPTPLASRVKQVAEEVGTDPHHASPYKGEGNNMHEPSAGVVRVEGYDISNLGSTGKVGSMVVFIHGQPDKRKYRKFKIRGIEGQSDVDCLAEVIERRLNHVEWPLPTVFLIDGGKPQVNRVKEILERRQVAIPVVGIAKGPERKRNDFILGSTDRDVILFVDTNREMLIRVRDEAHRFAVGYQRKLRRLM